MTAATDPFLWRVMDLNARYAAAIDDGALEDWPGFFTENCFYGITTADNHAQGLEACLMWLDSNAMLRDRVSALREANIFERHGYRHILGQPVPQPDTTGGPACASTPFLVARITREGQTDLFASGRYLDTFETTPHALKIARRLVVCDSSHVDTLLSLPL